MLKFIACFELRQIANCISLKLALVGQLALTVSNIHHVQLILVITRRTRIEYFENKFSTLIPIKPLGLIVHGLCFWVSTFLQSSVYIAKIISQRYAKMNISYLASLALVLVLVVVLAL